MAGIRLPPFTILIDHIRAIMEGHSGAASFTLLKREGLWMETRANY